MSCFFCNSLTHLSHKCDIYVDSDSRQKVAVAKKCCRHCLAVIPMHLRLYCFGKRLLSTTDDDLQCNNCSLKRSCLFCFSKTHHTVYCSSRLTESSFFVPKIDRDLMPRFIETMDLREKCILALLSPVIFKHVNVGPFFVIDSLKIDNTNIKDLQKLETKTLLTPKIVVHELQSYHMIQFNKIVLRTYLYRPISLILKSCFISKSNFLQMLSTNTKLLKCMDVTFKCVSFSQVIEKIPNIEILEFIKVYHMKIGNTWADDLLEYKKEKTLKEFTIAVDARDVNVISLASIFEHKCVHDAKICLTINDVVYKGERYRNFFNIREALITALSYCFIQIPFKKKNDVPRLTIEIKNESGTYFINRLYFTLKNILLNH